MSKTNSESNKRSPVSICMEVAYKERLMKEIKEYWEELLATEVLPDDRFYQRLIERSPWFGDFEDWCTEMESKQKDSDLWSRFPSNLQEKAYEIACEMDYLFPKKPLCKTFLPILMTSYCFKRGNKQPLVETLFYKDGRYLRFSKRKNLLFTSISK